LRRLKEYPAAATAFRRALALVEKFYAPDHQLVAEALENYAAVLRLLGRAEEADTHKLRAKEIRARLSLPRATVEQGASMTRH
jgi:tetratricopeptide (TPR) repeat protein